MISMKKVLSSRDNLTFRFMLATSLLIFTVMGIKFFWDYRVETTQAELAMVEKAQIITDQQKALWEFMAINQRKINHDSDGKLDYKYLSCSTVAMGVGVMLAAETDYTLEPIKENYRNLLNAPDNFELNGLTWLNENSMQTEYWAIDNIDGKKVFRYITPLYIDKYCLDCHGKPKGQIDISGYPKEGLEIGDFAGALSLTMPMDIYYDNIRKNILSNGFFSFMLVFVCVTSLYFLVTRMVTRPLGSLEQAVAQVKAGQWNVNLSNLKAKGEIKRLTNHFQAMTEQLKDLYINLELKVEQRTNELDKANHILKQQQQKLEHVNLRLKETNIYKSEFLAVMSHELRTPLTSIMAFTEMMLAESSSEDKDQQHCLQEVLQNSQILLELINNILDLAKIEAGKDRLALDVVDMTDIVVSVESVLAPLAKNKNLALHVDVAQNVPLTRADPEKIRRVVMNLAGNAVKFTDNGGNVEIMIRYNSSSNEIIIQVEDNGIGIKEENQKYIFEKFTQADSSSSRKYGGTGLGLSLAKELVALHQGWIKVESSYGEGSTFIVGLPVQEIE